MIKQIYLFYTFMIIYIINNNLVINNNYGRLKELIFLCKISMGTGNNFFEFYG